MSVARYALGVDLGTTYTSAATAGDGAPRVIQLTGTSHTIASIVSVTDDGLLAGEAAERRIISHPAATAREFKRRFGDPAPIVLDGTTYGADALTAALLSEVISRVEAAEGAAPSAVALAHPASWGPFRLDLLRAAAASAGVDDVQLVPEPVAAAVANSDRVEHGTLVAVYDLGGGTFDAAVVRCGDDWPVIGTPEGVERLGGIDFDQAILAHVDAAVDGQIFALDSSDPDARAALMRLRAECQAAKEQLSQHTDADISVVLPDLQTTVRLTRAEFEALVRPRLADSLNVLDRVVASAGVEWADISSVLLVGGSSNIPAVGQLVGEHTRRPVITATNPHLAVALGTAAIAQHSVLRTADVAPGAPTALPTGDRPPGAPTPTPATAAPTSATAAESGSGSRRPVAMIAAGIAAVAIAIGAFVMLGGENDENSDPPTASTTLATATDTRVGEGEATDGAIADDTTDSNVAAAPAVTTVPAASVAPPSELAAAVHVCATDVGDITQVAATSDALFLLAPSGLLSTDVVGLPDCVIDIAGAVAVDVGQPADVMEIASFDDVVAFGAPAGGHVVNRATGVVVLCSALTGTAAVDGDGALYAISGDVLSRFELDKTDGCTVADSSAFADLAATSVALGGRNLLAITGSDRATGDTQLWLFGGPRNRVVLDGFGQLDGVARCGENWCAVDAAAEVVHVLSTDGTTRRDIPLSDALTAPVSELLDLTSTRDAGAIALVLLTDGTTALLRLAP